MQCKHKTQFHYTKVMKKANKSAFSTLLKKIIFSIHELNRINHRHVCVFIAQFSLFGNDFLQHVSAERER